MKSRLKLILFLLVAFSMANCQVKKIPVFTSGTEGYKSFRIPAILALADGDLLAFCEGRVNGSSDFGHVEIVMKKSRDQGKTWSALQVVATYDILQAGGPAPVLDYSDPAYPQGRIFIFYNTGNRDEHEIKQGHGVKEVWYKTSTDNGETWGPAVNITLEVHKPRKPDINPAYDFAEDWRYYANTPGHAIQIQQGKYAGRIYIAANHSAGAPLPHGADYRAHGFYSDDHGKTFHLSQDVPVPGSNENMAAALNDNQLMLNIRNQSGSPRARIVAISHDGGQHWDSVYYDKNLPDPICQGSLLFLPSKKGRGLLAFCNAADTLKRDHLTLRLSRDEGRTWKQNYLVDQAPAGYKGDYSAYSDLVAISKSQIGILYERDNYREIIFTILPIKP